MNNDTNVGLVGIGKIGLPIAENLIKSGFRVRRLSPKPDAGIREARRHRGRLAG